MAQHGVKPALKTIKGGLDGVPPMPANLSSCMADEWNTIATDLKERRLLAKPMLGALETYVAALWMQREALKEIQTNGILVKTAHQVPKANPATAMLKAAQISIARLAAELGITPASQSRSGMGGDDPKPDDDDDLGL